jgi:hypothetical protein
LSQTSTVWAGSITITRRRSWQCCGTVPNVNRLGRLYHACQRRDRLVDLLSQTSNVWAGSITSPRLDLSQTSTVWAGSITSGDIDGPNAEHLVPNVNRLGRLYHKS